MFVLVDDSNGVTPKYFWKVTGGISLITLDMFQTEKFRTRDAAKKRCAEIPDDGFFKFRVAELTIK